MLRDRTGEISWTELSLFAGDLRERVASSKLGNPGEFDRALAGARPALEDLSRLGGDPRFALGVLVAARWRRLRSPGANFPKWIRALERLSGSEELDRAPPRVSRTSRAIEGRRRRCPPVSPKLCLAGRRSL